MNPWGSPRGELPNGKLCERGIVVREEGGSQWASCFFLPPPLVVFFSGPRPHAHVCVWPTWRDVTAILLESRRVTEGVFFPACRTRCLTRTRFCSHRCRSLAQIPFARSRSHSHQRPFAPTPLSPTPFARIDGCLLEDLISHDGSALTRTYAAYFFRDGTLFCLIVPPVTTHFYYRIFFNC